MTPKLKKIILIIVVIVLLFLVYAIFFKSDPQADVLVSGTNSLGAASDSITSQESRVLASQIAQALSRVEQITLERAIFSNPIYLSLTDRSRPIIDEPIGRTNPFAPLSDTSVNVAPRATSTATSSPSTQSQPPQVQQVQQTTQTQTPSGSAPVSGFDTAPSAGN